MSKVTIHVHGYGSFTIKRPKEHSDEAFNDAIAKAVKKTMNLVDPRGGPKFHLVYGFERPENMR